MSKLTSKLDYNLVLCRDMTGLPSLHILLHGEITGGKRISYESYEVRPLTVTDKRQKILPRSPSFIFGSFNTSRTTTTTLTVTVSTHPATQQKADTTLAS